MSSETLAVQVCQDVDDAEWASVLERDARSTPFHRPRFCREFAEHFGGVTISWVEVRDPAGALVAGLPVFEKSVFGLRRIWSGLAGFYGGPICDPSHPEAEAALAEWFSHQPLGVVSRELVWAHRDAPFGSWADIQPLSTASIRVDEDADLDDLYRSVFSRRRRNEINQNLRAGMTVSFESGAESLPEFYAIYVEQCRQWKAEPIPVAALECVLKLLPEASLVVARGPEGEMLGAHLCIELPGELFAWVGTSVRRKNLFAPVMLIREELRWCLGHGRRCLNLGTSGGRDTVQAFKTNLNASEDDRWIVRQDRRPWRRGES